MRECSVVLKWNKGRIQRNFSFPTGAAEDADLAHDMQQLEKANYGGHGYLRNDSAHELVEFSMLSIIDLHVAVDTVTISVPLEQQVILWVQNVEVVGCHTNHRSGAEQQDTCVDEAIHFEATALSHASAAEKDRHD